MNITTDENRQDISEACRAEMRQSQSDDIRVLSRLKDLNVKTIELTDPSAPPPTSVDELLVAMRNQFVLIQQIDEAMSKRCKKRSTFRECVHRAQTVLTHAESLLAPKDPQDPQAPRQEPGSGPLRRMTQSFLEMSALLARLPSMAVEIVEDSGAELDESPLQMPRHLPRLDSALEAVDFMWILKEAADELEIAPSSEASQRLKEFKKRRMTEWLQDPQALISLHQVIAAIHPVLVEAHDRQRPHDELLTRLDVPPFEYPETCPDIANLIAGHQRALRAMEDCERSLPR